MEPAFWDSSSLVPLCVIQSSTPVVNQLNKKYEMVVWWATPVEVRSAFTRLIRMRDLTPNGQIQAQIALDGFRSKWSEIQPARQVRAEAERFLDRFPLRAADALQLAAAFVWTSGRPLNRPFISGDLQLLDAAGQLGFKQIRA
jgi:predicted nucleic acid-binding protein